MSKGDGSIQLWRSPCVYVCVWVEWVFTGMHVTV